MAKQHVGLNSLLTHKLYTCTNDASYAATMQSLLTAGMMSRVLALNPQHSNYHNTVQNVQILSVAVYVAGMRLPGDTMCRSSHERMYGWLTLQSEPYI